MRDQIHRAVHSAEHDKANGLIHVFCLLCGVPYPCDYIGTVTQTSRILDLEKENERLSRERDVFLEDMVR